MFCPNCSANNSTEQNFCRSCGLNLEDTAKSLLAQIPSAETAALMRREKMLEKFGNTVWSGFGTVTLIGIGALVYTIIASLVLSGKNPLLGILLAAFIVFAALTLIYVFFNEDLKEKRKKINPAAAPEFSEVKTTGKFLEEKPFEPVPSVIEDSTELLFVENKTKRLK
jgi:hypothetical protein